MYDWDCGQEEDDEIIDYCMERKKIFYSHNEIGATKDFPFVWYQFSQKYQY